MIDAHTIDDRVEPINPSHPGELLRDWIDGHGATVTDTAKRLNVSRAKLNRVLAGKGPMVASLAVDLESIGWSTARFWLALQAQYDIAALRRDRAQAA